MRELLFTYLLRTQIFFPSHEAHDGGANAVSNARCMCMHRSGLWCGVE